ncbi:MAG: nucleotidyltransferase substrate binding protein [Balneolaceae bacterium]
MAEKLHIEPLEKAILSLEKALKIEPVTDIVRDASIQRFEYSFELSWKFMKRYLKEYAGIEEHQIKEIFRQSAKVGLIENPEHWFDYHKARNLTTHTYNEEIAEETFDFAKQFLRDALVFLQNINKLLS